MSTEAPADLRGLLEEPTDHSDRQLSARLQLACSLVFAVGRASLVESTECFQFGGHRCFEEAFPNTDLKPGSVEQKGSYQRVERQRISMILMDILVS